MQAVQASKARLLIVEDDGDLHELFARIARREGYETISASTGEEALSILRGPERIDWLLTDVRLPGVIDGWVVGSEFTLNHPLRPVIYASAYAPDFARQVAGSVFMRKPVKIKEIVATFKDLTSRFETQMSDSAGLRMAQRPSPAPAPMREDEAPDLAAKP